MDSKCSDGQSDDQICEKNQFGILDHDVILEPGVTIHNPMRVLPNGRTSEVIFTLFRQPDSSNEKFPADAKWVAEKAGAKITDPAHDRFWGGYSGYFQDLDGEITWNPQWEVKE